MYETRSIGGITLGSIAMLVVPRFPLGRVPSPPIVPGGPHVESLR